MGEKASFVESRRGLSSLFSVKSCMAFQFVQCFKHPVFSRVFMESRLVSFFLILVYVFSRLQMERDEKEKSSSSDVGGRNREKRGVA